MQKNRRRRASTCPFLPLISSKSIPSIGISAEPDILELAGKNHHLKQSTITDSQLKMLIKVRMPHSLPRCSVLAIPLGYREQLPLQSSWTRAVQTGFSSDDPGNRFRRHCAYQWRWRGRFFLYSWKWRNASVQREQEIAIAQVWKVSARFVSQNPAISKFGELPSNLHCYYQCYPPRIFLLLSSVKNTAIGVFTAKISVIHPKIFPLQMSV